MFVTINTHGKSVNTLKPFLFFENELKTDVIIQSWTIDG